MPFLRKINRTLLLLILPLLVISCSTAVTLTQESVDTKVDIASFTTYAWDTNSRAMIEADETRTVEFSPLLRKTIEAALKNLGYEKRDSGEVDFTVDFQITLKESEFKNDPYPTFLESNQNFDDINPYEVQWRFGMGERPVYVGFIDPASELKFFQVGTFHIGAFDSNQKIVWHVTASKIINKNHSRDEHDKVIQDVTRQLMQYFPSKRL